MKKEQKRIIRNIMEENKKLKESERKAVKEAKEQRKQVRITKDYSNKIRTVLKNIDFLQQFLLSSFSLTAKDFVHC